MTDRIVRIHADSGGTYGVSRITVALRREGAVVNHKRVARIMRERGVQGVTRRRRRPLTRSDGKVPLAPDLLHRDFTAPRPATLLVGDITCAPTREGWVYLAVLLDLCTRQVVGRAMATRQNAALVITVLRTAFQTGHLDNDAIVHTDRGTQYTCAAYRRELARIGARQSLSRSGSCLDNAPAESFFASLKTEIGRLLWDTQRTAMDDINRWIGQFYNNTRRLQSPIGYYTSRDTSEIPRSMSITHSQPRRHHDSKEKVKLQSTSGGHSASRLSAEGRRILPSRPQEDAPTANPSPASKRGAHRPNRQSPRSGNRHCPEMHIG